MQNIKVRKYYDELLDFEQIDLGNWIDVRATNVAVTENDKAIIKNNMQNKFCDIWKENRISYKKGDVVIVRLGFAMELPEGYEADVKPRSSTFINYGLLLTNSVGTIDNSYKGNDDEWTMIFYATRDGEIERFDRVGQFRIQKCMPLLHFEYVKNLEGKSRGGYGSTGVKGTISDNLEKEYRECCADDDYVDEDSSDKLPYFNPVHGGFRVNIKNLRVGTEFYVTNENWNGKIVNIDGKKKLFVKEDKSIKDLEDSWVLWINITKR